MLMMKIKSIRFKNYKAFKEEQELEIKPITILIGKNSSGKSIVTRLPLLLAQSLSTESNSPIELQFDGIEFGGSFKDLVHNKIDHGHISFGLTIEEADSRISVELTIQNIADSPIQLISFYKVTSNIGLNITLEWLIDNEIKLQDGYQHYKVTGDIEGNCYVKFKGLQIASLINQKGESSNLEDIIAKINQILSESTKPIDYIGPFREFPKRDYIYKGSKPAKTGYFGELAPQILGIDSYLDKTIINSVGEWFEQNLGGWKLDIEKIREKFEIVLISPDDPKVKINLVDVGHGMSQVLPLIVRSYAKSSSANGIMIIEQPELHLHPAAHGNLAELFVNIINEEKSNWILETHSEVFVLRIRRMIAEKKLDANDAIIYLVDDEERPGSVLKKITINELGEVSTWPSGIFSEDYEEVVAIKKANLK
jgi:hypothetical protein